MHKDNLSLFESEQFTGVCVRVSDWLFTLSFCVYPSNCPTHLKVNVRVHE